MKDEKRASVPSDGPSLRPACGARCAQSPCQPSRTGGRMAPRSPASGESRSTSARPATGVVRAGDKAVDGQMTEDEGRPMRKMMRRLTAIQLTVFLLSLLIEGCDVANGAEHNERANLIGQLDGITWEVLSRFRLIRPKLTDDCKDIISSRYCITNRPYDIVLDEKLYLDRVSRLARGELNFYKIRQASLNPLPADYSWRNLSPDLTPFDMGVWRRTYWDMALGKYDPTYVSPSRLMVS